MTDIILCFEVHQPFRIKRDFYWRHGIFRRVKGEELLDYYFDRELNKEIFDRVSRKCYIPATEILLSLIDQHRRTKKKVKISFSLSGCFLDQCEMFNKDLLELFKQLAETGCVEFLCQTYYHSLAGLYEEREEFFEQVKMHQEAMKNLLNFEPKIFENSELIFNNIIARDVEKLGFMGIFTEGADRLLGWRSPNYVYRVRGCERLRVLMRNYRLTDDIAFRFSARWWSEWPLTADKFAAWLAATPGQYIAILPDYETFGEHHWPESGIHEFLRHMVLEILKWDHLQLSTPSEVLERHEAVGEIDVQDFSSTVSWAGIDRDLSHWLENPLQWAYFVRLQALGHLVKESEDEALAKVWRYLQTSDHLHAMYMGGGDAGIVHAYFSHFGIPSEAFIACQAAILDFESNVRRNVIAADDSFYFCEAEGKFTGLKAHSLKGFVKALSKASAESLEFHNCRGDFERWAQFSIRDEELVRALREIRKSGVTSEELRQKIQKVASDRLNAMTKELEII